MAGRQGAGERRDYFQTWKTKSLLLMNNNNNNDDERQKWADSCRWVWISVRTYLSVRLFELFPFFYKYTGLRRLRTGSRPLLLFLIQLSDMNDLLARPKLWDGAVRMKKLKKENKARDNRCWRIQLWFLHKQTLKNLTWLLKLRSASQIIIRRQDDRTKVKERTNEWNN